MDSQGVRNCVPSDTGSVELGLRDSERAAHSAASAWLRFSPNSTPPMRVHTLKGPRVDFKSAVFELGPVGLGGMDVVAKELFCDAARIERTVYRSVLPKLSVSGPRFIGWVGSDDPQRDWLFLGAVAGEPFDKTNPNHVATASRWLAALHAETSGRNAELGIPRRGPELYEKALAEGVAGLEEVSHNKALDLVDRRLLREISDQLETLTSGWALIAEVYSALPTALVHGDFKGNNMAFSGQEDELLVFDWSEAHWGPMAIDLSSVDLGVYHFALRERGPAFELETLEEWKRLGLLLRTVMAISWEIPRLEFPWVERPMRRMVLYESRLRASIENSAWL